MSSITLPSTPMPSIATPKPLDFGGWQVPEFGGPATRIDRFGNRFSLTLSIPRLKPEPDGRIWAATLVMSIGQTVICPFYQAGFNVGAPGTVRVDGGGQAGTSLAVDGATPHYAFKFGQFVTLVSGGRHYVHMIAAQVIADAAGEAVLTIEPMLRVIPANNDLVLVAAPQIEGMLTGATDGWTMERARRQGLTFTIAEIE